MYMYICGYAVLLYHHLFLKVKILPKQQTARIPLLQKSKNQVYI